MQNQIENQRSSEGKLGPVVRYVALSVVFVFGILSIIATTGPADKIKPNPFGLQTNEELRAEIGSLQQKIRQIEDDDQEYQEAIRQGFPIKESSSEAVAHEARIAEINRLNSKINDINKELQRRGPE